MRPTFMISSLIAMTALAATAIAAQLEMAMPKLVWDEAVAALPKGDSSEVRVFTATLNPGDKTPTHTHRFPVITYVLEGSFTLERKGASTLTVNAGHVFLETPGVETTGSNQSPDKVAKVIIFSVSTPNMPFLDPIK
ncbi:MAG: cupin domain-containing protein [Pseudomonadota bacterium]|nr:cupin domain-containing protein [Pseudomonadota bacterium]